MKPQDTTSRFTSNRASASSVLLSKDKQERPHILLRREARRARRDR